MTSNARYTKINDLLPVHPTIEHLSDAAFRLYIEAACHLHFTHSGGRIDGRWITSGCQGDPVRQAERRKAADELTAAGLWMKSGDDWEIVRYIGASDPRPPALQLVKS